MRKVGIIIASALVGVLIASVVPALSHSGGWRSHKRSFHKVKRNVNAHEDRLAALENRIDQVGFTGYNVKNDTFTVSAGQTEDETVTCAEGKSVISGGYSGSNENIRILADRPTADEDGWRISATNNGANDETLVVWATCANI